MAKEFCPDYCNFLKDHPKYCATPGPLSDGKNPEKDRCHHLDDKPIIPPKPVSIKRTRNEWADAQIIGENGDSYYIEEWGFSGNTRSVGRVQKNSPLIRKRK